MKIVLASSSKYRQSLLAKLGIPFECDSPNIDETPLSGETPEALVQRLALEKAKAVAGKHNNSLVIGSDQVATLNGSIITKPGSHASAVKQLEQSSGQAVSFITGLCLFDSANNSYQLISDHYKVHFKTLSRDQIEGYLKQEQPYDCAGSFKSEGLGIALFHKLEGDDPNSLIGLPIIRLIEMLRTHNIDPLIH